MPGDLSLYALLSTAVIAALLHTLIPDHWLPFVLIGRAREWSGGTTALVSGLSALIHALVSVLLGLGALALGVTAAEAIGETLESASGILLIVFGLGYAIWSWRKGGHFHPGGASVHTGESDAGCAGEEGDSNPEHLHYHADQNLILGRTQSSAWWLALIIGANPCIPLLPLMFSTAQKGPAAVGLMALAYSIPTVVIMVGLSVAGVVATRRFRVPGIARHMEAASGVVIALLGVLFLFSHH